MTIRKHLFILTVFCVIFYFLSVFILNKSKRLASLDRHLYSVGYFEGFIEYEFVDLWAGTTLLTSGAKQGVEIRIASPYEAHHRFIASEKVGSDGKCTVRVRFSEYSDDDHFFAIIGNRIIATERKIRDKKQKRGQEQ